MASNSRSSCPATGNDVQTLRYRKDRLKKLLEGARDLASHDLRIVAEFLVDDQVVGIHTVTQMLRGFSSSLTSIPSFDISHLPAAIHLSKCASASLERLACILAALNMRSEYHEDLDPLRAQCLDVFVEEWPSLARWMSHLIRLGSKAIDEFRVVVSCTMMLYHLCLGADDDPRKEEIAVHPSTPDLVCLLFSKKKTETGRYYSLHAHDVGCRIAHLFFALLSCDATRGAMIIGLRDMRVSKRRATIAALISRAGHLVSEADTSDLETVAESVDFLLKGVTYLTEDPRLRREIEEENFMVVYASAPHSLLKKAETYSVSTYAFWDTLAGSVVSLVSGSGSAISLATNPISVLPKLVDAGLFTCAAACLPHQIVRSPKSVTRFLQGIQPYLYLSKVCIPANDRGDFKVWWGTTPAHVRIQGPEAKLRVVEFYTCMQLSNRTLVERDEGQVNLCSNLWHDFSKPCGAAASLKTCSQCHSVTYCSLECQEEDWDEVHSRECRGLAGSYRARRDQGTWTTMQTKIDQLAFLDMYMNTHCPSARELRSQPLVDLTPEAAQSHDLSENFGITHHPDSSIVQIEYHMFGEGVGHQPRLSLARSLQLGLCAAPSVCLWIPRMQWYVGDMEQDPDGVVLVEGVFKFTPSTSMTVWAKMRYSLGAPEGERYTIVNSFFGLVDREAVELTAGFRYCEPEVATI